MKALILLKKMKEYFGSSQVLIQTQIDEAIEDLESLQNRKCENCKHYSTGKQPDGFEWHKCDYAFECKTCFNDYFEKAE